MLIFTSCKAFLLLQINTADIQQYFCSRNTRARYEICSKLTVRTPERREWRCLGVFIVNFEHISHLVLVFLLLTLNMWMSAGKRILYFSSPFSVANIRPIYHFYTPWKGQKTKGFLKFSGAWKWNIGIE